MLRVEYCRPTDQVRDQVKHWKPVPGAGAVAGRRSVCWLAVATRWAALLWAASSCNGQVLYSGDDLGPGWIENDGSRITVSNTAISASWLVGEPGLKPQFVRDVAGQTQVALSGEAFEIVLTNGQRYASSRLQLKRPPRIKRLAPEPKAARLAERLPGRQVELPMRSADGCLEIAWRVLLHDGDNYVRQQLDVSVARGECAIQEVIWLNQAIQRARTVGSVDGSPIVAGNFFLAAEDPHARNEVHGPDGQASAASQGDRAVCSLPWNAVLKRGEPLSASFVMGVAPVGQMRRGFLYYLERERAHPYRPYLHYNSWYDIAWTPFALNETNCLDAIHTFGERFIKPFGVVMDGMVFDDGWDNPKTLWRFHSGFPHGFTPLDRLCHQYHTHLGVWLSPFGGYGEPREERLKFGHQQGYETNAAGFSLAGPKYYAAFEEACARMIRRYGVNHFKFDGIASGMYASGGGPYLRDTQALRRLMVELRQEDPNLYINLTTGSWPSPFWLFYVDSVWRQGDDMGLAGRGPAQQRWLTYRDQEVWANIVRHAPLFPLNSLMSQGVAYSRKGSAGDPTFNSAGFKDDVRAFFGSGTSLQELYIQPGKLTTEDWHALAEAAKWSRANSDVLIDTHWIGGDPARLQVYGYASWSPRKGIVTLRNPDDQAHDFSLDVGAALELPAGAPRKFLLTSPWAEGSANPPLACEIGHPLALSLAAFETLVLDAQPCP
jgi:hypothetical protein